MYIFPFLCVVGLECTRATDCKDGKMCEPAEPHLRLNAEQFYNTLQEPWSFGIGRCMAPGRQPIVLVTKTPPCKQALVILVVLRS